MRDCNFLYPVPNRFPAFKHDINRNHHQHNISQPDPELLPPCQPIYIHCHGFFLLALHVIHPFNIPLPELHKNPKRIYLHFRRQYIIPDIQLRRVYMLPGFIRCYLFQQHIPDTVALQQSPYRSRIGLYFCHRIPFNFPDCFRPDKSSAAHFLLRLATLHKQGSYPDKGSDEYYEKPSPAAQQIF